MGKDAMRNVRLAARRRLVAIDVETKRDDLVEIGFGNADLTTAVDDDTRAVRTVITLDAPDPADSFVEEHVQFVHSDDDVRRALDGAGLDLLEVTDEYTDSPLTSGALRATWVARRRVHP